MRREFLCFLAVLLAVSAAMNIDTNKKKCRALVLEGGGDKGSYQAGVLKAFVDNLSAQDVMYDVVTGVSVGSINGAGIALHKIGQEKATVEWLLKLWRNITPGNIYQSWPLGLFQAISYEEGLWDNQPEVEFLTEAFSEFESKKIHRKLNINTVDFDSGEVVRYNETTPFEQLPLAVVASTAMPFAFPHSHMDNRTFVDGGSVWNIDISGAIERCMEVVQDEEDIIIDVILCTGAQNTTRDEHKEWSTVDNYIRYLEIKGYYAIMSDYIELAREYKDRVHFRYFVAPQGQLPSGYLPLGFAHDSIEAMIQLGIKEGQEAILEGEFHFVNRIQELLKKGKVYF